MSDEAGSDDTSSLTDDEVSVPDSVSVAAAGRHIAKTSVNISAAAIIIFTAFISLFSSYKISCRKIGSCVKVLLTKQANRFYMLGEREHIDGLNFLYLVPAVYKRF